MIKDQNVCFTHICNTLVCVVYIAYKKGLVTPIIEVKKNLNPLGGIKFLHNPFQSFLASKTSNGHWSKVNSTFCLKSGLEERK